MGLGNLKKGDILLRKEEVKKLLINVEENIIM